MADVPFPEVRIDTDPEIDNTDVPFPDVPEIDNTPVPEIDNTPVPTYGKKYVESGEYNNDYIFWKGNVGLSQDETWSRIAETISPRLKNSQNPADRAAYAMMPWKINKNNEFDPNVPPPIDVSTGKARDYWYNAEEFVKAHVPLHDSPIAALTTEASLALGAGFPALKVGSTAASITPGPWYLKGIVGVGAGVSTFLGLDAALRQGVEYAAENLSILPQGITKEDHRTGLARAWGQFGQYGAEMFPFTYGFGKIAKKADLENIDFGRAYYKEKLENLINPSFSPDSATYQSYYNLLQSSYYNKQHGIRNSAENITKELLTTYQNNPVLFNGLELFTGFTGAGAASVVEYNKPDSIWTSMGAEAAATTFTPGRMFGRVLLSAWPIIQAGTGLTVNTIFHPIQTKDKLVDLAHQGYRWHQTRAQRKSTESATEWLAQAIRNNAEALKKEHGDKAPSPVQILDGLLGHFLTDPLVIHAEDGSQTVINTIEDIEGLGNFADLVEPGTDPVKLTPFQKTHSDLFGAIERLMQTNVGSPTERAQFKSQSKAAHNDAMTILGKLLVTFSSQGNHESLKVATKLQADLLDDYLSSLVGERTLRAATAARKLGYKDGVQLAAGAENLRTELLNLQTSLRDIATDYYIKAAEKATAQGGKKVTLAPTNTYEMILDLVDDSRIQKDIPKLISSRINEKTHRIDPSDPDAEEILVDFDHVEKEKALTNLGELHLIFNKIARQSGYRRVNVGEEVEEVIIGANAATDPFVAAKLRQQTVQDAEGSRSLIDELQPLDEVDLTTLIAMRSKLLKEARKLMGGPEQDRVLAKQYVLVADSILDDLGVKSNTFDPLTNADGTTTSSDVAWKKFLGLEGWQQDFMIANTLSRKINDVFTRTFFQEFLQTKGSGQYTKSAEELISRLESNFKGNGLRGIGVERIVRKRMEDLTNPDRIADPESEHYGQTVTPAEEVPEIYPDAPQEFTLTALDEAGVDFSSTENALHFLMRGVFAFIAAKQDPQGIANVGSGVRRARDLHPYTERVGMIRDDDVKNPILQMTGPSELAQTRQMLQNIFEGLDKNDVIFHQVENMIRDFDDAGTAGFNLAVAEEVSSRFNKMRELKTNIYQLTDDVTPYQYFDRLFNMQNRKVSSEEFNSFVDFIAEVANPTGGGGGFPLEDLDLKKIGTTMGQLGIPENQLEKFLVDFERMAQGTREVDRTLLKESAVDGFLQAALHHANMKVGNDKANFTNESLAALEDILVNPMAGKGKDGPSVMGTLIDKGLLEPAHARNLIAILQKAQKLNLDPASLASITPDDPDLVFKILIARLSGAAGGRKLAEKIGTHATLQFAAIGSQAAVDLVNVTPTAKAVPMLFEMVRPGNEEFVADLLRGARQSITKPGTVTRYSQKKYMDKFAKLYSKFLSSFFNPSVIATSLHTNLAQEAFENRPEGFLGGDPNLEEEMPSYRRYDPRLPENRLDAIPQGLPLGATEPVDVRPIDRPLTMLPRPNIPPPQTQPRSMGPVSPPSPDRMRFAGLFPEDITSGLIQQGALNQGIGSLAG